MSFSGYWDAYKASGTLSPEAVDSLVATGFSRRASDTSRPDFVNIKDAPGYYHQTLGNTVKIVAWSVLGLTLQCACCHAHKYDPVTQADYYRFQAIFMSGYRPDQWVAQVGRGRFEATEAAEIQTRNENARIDAAIVRRKTDAAGITSAFGERRFSSYLEALLATIPDDVRTSFATPRRKAERNSTLPVREVSGGASTLALGPCETPCRRVATQP